MSLDNCEANELWWWNNHFPDEEIWSIVERSNHGEVVAVCVYVNNPVKTETMALGHTWRFNVNTASSHFIKKWERIV